MKEKILAALTALMTALAPAGQFGGEIGKTVSALEQYPSPTLTLAAVTDIHYDPSKPEPSVVKPTFSVIREIGSRLEASGRRIDAIWNLGDFINGHNTTKAEAAEQIRTVIAAQRQTGIDYHNIAGNNDSNGSTQDPASEAFSADELNAVLENRDTSRTEHRNSRRPTDYYVDFPTVRVVCLSAEETSFLPETAEWLREEALTTGSEVLVLSHIPSRPEWGFMGDVKNGEAIEGALADFISAGGTVIAWIHGHDHGDIINVVEAEDGTVLYREIGIGCARFQVPTSNGTPSMTYWQRNDNDETMILFDIVTIDQEHRTVRFTRVGAGKDRQITY